MNQHTEQGLAIRAERIARNMTQADLAGLAGVSEKTVRRGEAGERIAADSVRSLCAALDLDAEDLRREAEMSPRAGHEVDERYAKAAFAAKTGATLLVLSCCLTMAALAFEIPAGLAHLLVSVLAVAATLAILTATTVLLAKPDWRERFLATPVVKRVLGRIDAFDGLGRFVLCMLATPPAIGMAIHALRELVHAPGAGTAFVLALNLALAAGLSALAVSLIQGDALTGAKEA